MLSRLFDGFPERDAEAEARAGRYRAYMIAIEGLPLDALEIAERRIIRGEIEGIDRRFLPAPPELAGIVRGIVAEERAKALPKPATLSLERFEAPPDPAMVQKFDKVIGEFTKVADIEGHETRAQWLKRMGDRVKLREDAA